ncbi:MAG: hypothetical protein RR212_10885 [Bacteroidales bacterium]
MGFNPIKTNYEIFVLRSEGNKYNLGKLVTSCTWREMENDYVCRATITMANVKTSLGCWTEHITPLGSRIFIFANGQQVFCGTVWNHRYRSEKSSETIEVTANDWMIYLSQSKDSAYFGAGALTIDVCEQTCQRWGIDVRYQYFPYNHGKLVFKNKSIMDQLSEVCTECQDKNNGRKFIMQFESDMALYIRGQGYNDTVYVLTGGELGTRSLISVELESSLDNLVTKVNVLGKADDEGRESVEASVEGDTSFGVLQEQIYRDNDKSIEETTAEAQGILDKKGKPEHAFSITCPDIPFVRKGHRIHCVFSAEINDYFYVLSVTHNVSSRTMDLKMEKAVK